LKSFGDIRPGDIVQFENAVFVRQRLREDGALVTLTFSYPHHVAIVEKVRKRGPKPTLVILHQNAGVAGGDADDLKVVQEWTINMVEKRNGTVRAYRPVAEWWHDRRHLGRKALCSGGRRERGQENVAEDSLLFGADPPVEREPVDVLQAEFDRLVLAGQVGVAGDPFCRQEETLKDGWESDAMLAFSDWFPQATVGLTFTILGSLKL
jgi:hypothetical protein